MKKAKVPGHKLVKIVSYAFEIARNHPTSKYGKWPCTHQLGQFDYQTIGIFEVVMTKDEMIERFREFIMNTSSFGINGGTREGTKVTANWCFNCMLKEGIIVMVDA